MAVSLAPRLQTERTDEAIEAWRVWSLTGSRDGTDLLLRPVAGRRRPWLPMQPAEASCKLGRFHEAPALDCTCGLYGTHEPDILRRTKTPGVLGRVALWGRVIEHELGFRARFGYPQRLRLACYLCFWQRSVPYSHPDVVAWMGRSQLIPLCDPHVDLSARYGMAPRDLLAANDVEQALRSTYAVDAMAI